MKTGLDAWKFLIVFIWRYFSIIPLFKVLFKPFHSERISFRDSRTTLFEALVFNLLMRVIGAVPRLLLIFVGLVVSVLALFLLPLFISLNISIKPETFLRHRALGRDLSVAPTPMLRRVASEISHVGKTVLMGNKVSSVERLGKILARERQNNALIVGRPGVGRMTLAEEMARRIEWGETLPVLQYKRVFQMDIQGVDADTLQKVLYEAVRAGNIILIIKNIHSAREMFDDMLPFIEAPGIRIVGVTDFDNYHAVLKKRPDFLKGFEKIELDEPDEKKVSLLLAAILDSRGVSYEKDVPHTIVQLTGRLVSDVPQPEKSIDILEELLAPSPKQVTVDDVNHLITEKTGVPVGAVSQQEKETLLHLEDILKNNIVGQEEVIKSIAESLRRARSGISNANRPIASFIFLGSTGVGKTHTAKMIAKSYYGDEKAMIRFDMTEFSQGESVEEFSRRLVVAIEDNPFSLVLFDEIEKAHVSIKNLFLQILDEARITDTNGREAHFQNAFIVCTSNAGSNMLSTDPHIQKDTFVQQLIAEKLFSPEFLNRFDGICMFTPHTKEDARDVADMILRDFSKHIQEEKGINIVFEPGLVDALARLAFNSTFGGREIRRVMESKIANFVADKILTEGIGSDGAISIPVSVVDSPHS